MTQTVLLSIDALRADRLSASHFSQCWKLFEEEFCIFRNAYSHGTATPLAFPGLITGRTPKGDGSLEKDAITLAEMHEGKSLARINNPHLNADRGYNRGFTEFKDAEGQGGAVQRLKEKLGNSETLRRTYHRVRRVLPNEVIAADLPYTPAERISEWVVDALSDHPDFLWAHYMDPHTPHTRDTITDRELTAPHEKDYQTLTDRFHDGTATEKELGILRDLYDAHIRYLDRHLSRALTAMQSHNWWEEALVIIVGDHGEAFGEHGQMAHEWDGDPIDEIVRTPLAVKFPGNTDTSKRRDHLVAHRDIHAEVAAHTNTTLANTGRSLRDDSPRLIVSKSNSAIRVTTEDGWLIRRRDKSEDTNGTVTKEMRDTATAESFPRVPLLSGDVVGENADDTVEDRLEALGYR